VTVDAATTHRDAPPPIDLAGHFRDLARMLLPALLIGAIVGGAVFAYLSAQTKEYSASVVTQVTTQNEVVAGDAFVEQLRAPFEELANDDGVLAQVLTQVSTGWDTATLRSHVTLTPGTAPSLLTFSATADSPRTAQQISRAMVAAVAQANEANAARDVARRVDQIDASIAFEQARNGRLAPNSDARTQSDARLAELRAQRDQIAGAGGNQLTVLSVPAASSSPVSPKPMSTALVAGIVGFIVAAELLVLARGRLGSRNNRIWARRIAHKHGARLLVAGPGPFDASKLLYGELAHRHRRGRSAVILTGGSANVVDVVVPGGTTEEWGQRVEQGALVDDWWRDVDLGDLVAAVVVVTAKGRDRSTTAEALAQLADLGATRYLVLQTRRGGRFRRGTKGKTA
jgi:capsular polysaccharide biosynthesis protein